MFINVNQQVIYYETYGSGHPIVLVHGNGETHEVFDVVSAQLAEHFTVYALDSRGHGQSSSVPVYHYFDMMEDVAAFIKKLELKNAYFFGFSDGGIIGLLLAIHHPTLIGNLMIAGPNVNPHGLKSHFYYPILLHHLFKKDPFVRLMLREPHIAYHELNYISVPTLILAGENDIIKPKHLKKIAAHIKHSMLKILPCETHTSYVVSSPKLFPLLWEFISSNSQTQL